MVKRLFLILFPLGLAFGQLTPNSVTVTATKNLTVQPDQVVFGVTVVTPLDTSRDAVLAALQGSGITAVNFAGISTTQMLSGIQNVTLLQWYFTLPAPLSDMKSTIASLTALQQSIAQKKNGMSLSFSVQGLQVSQQLAQSQQCILTDLLADARAQAQKIATAASMSLGNIQAISSPTVSTVPSASFLLGSVSTVTVPPVCTLTVKFGLGVM